MIVVVFELFAESDKVVLTFDVILVMLPFDVVVIDGVELLYFKLLQKWPTHK
jgi:hypothetical protein